MGDVKYLSRNTLRNLKLSLLTYFRRSSHLVQITGLSPRIPIIVQRIRICLCWAAWICLLLWRIRKRIVRRILRILRLCWRISVGVTRHGNARLRWSVARRCWISWHLSHTGGLLRKSRGRGRSLGSRRWRRWQWSTCHGISWCWWFPGKCCRSRLSWTWLDTHCTFWFPATSWWSYWAWSWTWCSLLKFMNIYTSAPGISTLGELL